MQCLRPWGHQELTNCSALLKGTHLGEEVLLGMSLLFLSGPGDGGGKTAGLDPGGASPGNLFDEGGSGETTKLIKVYSKRKTKYSIVKIISALIRTSQILDYRYPILTQ